MFLNWNKGGIMEIIDIIIVVLIAINIVITSKIKEANHGDNKRMERRHPKH